MKEVFIRENTRRMGIMGIGNIGGRKYLQSMGRKMGEMVLKTLIRLFSKGGVTFLSLQKKQQKKQKTQLHNIFMTNSDVELLFTNIQRNETIEDCFEDLFSNKLSKKFTSCNRLSYVKSVIQYILLSDVSPIICCS